MYHSIVLVKQVPDTANITGNVMQDDGTVNRSKLPAIFNPEDRVALEMALRIKDQFGGKITVMTMGPPRASDILRECLYMGADEGVLISDRKFAGADTLATSYVLSEAIKKEGAYDFIFAGRQAIDALGERGYQTIYMATGPHVNHLLLADNALDRLYTTVAHRLLGGEPFSSLVEGDLLRPAVGMRLHAHYFDPHALDGLGQQFVCYERE